MKKMSIFFTSEMQTDDLTQCMGMSCDQVIAVKQVHISEQQGGGFEWMRRQVLKGIPFGQHLQFRKIGPHWPSSSDVNVSFDTLKIDHPNYVFNLVENYSLILPFYKTIIDVFTKNFLYILGSNTKEYTEAKKENLWQCCFTLTLHFKCSAISGLSFFARCW